MIRVFGSPEVVEQGPRVTPGALVGRFGGYLKALFWMVKVCVCVCVRERERERERNKETDRRRETRNVQC